MGNMCLVVTPEIQNVANQILQKYPEACNRAGFSANMCAEWIGAYNKEMNKKPDFIPDHTALIHFVEKKRNMDGKSFLYIPEEITYALPGQKVQTYTVIGNKIFNKKGQEVFSENIESLKTHRTRVLANLTVQRGEAVVVDHKGHKYVVYKNNDILSVSSSKIMKWGEENGDRKEILRLSQIAFREKQKAETAIDNLTVATEDDKNYVKQLIDHLKASGINVFDKAAMDKFFKEHPNMAPYIQQAIKEQREMQDIKDKAIADGTFMKAPNGNDTNLTERQWLQVRTKAFKKWFGDWINDPANASKVIDENGEPLVVYHFTDDEFTSFKGSTRGLHFTSDSKGENIFDPNPNTKKISMPVFLNIKNPAYEWDAKYWLNKGDWDTYNKLRFSAFERGISPSEKKERLQKANSIFSTERTLGNEESGISALKKTNSAKDGIIRDNDTDYIAFNSNQVKSATDNNGMFSTENDDIMMSIDRFVNKNSLPKGELPSLSSALITKYGNKTAYGDVIQTANYEYTINYKGAGEFDIIEYHLIDNNLKDKVYDKSRRSSGSYDRLSLRDELAEGECNSDSYHVTKSEADEYDAGLDKETRQGESQQVTSNDSSKEYQGRSTRLSKTGADGTNFPRVIEIDDILAFITSQGEIYGFVDKDGNMYLDETIIDASHPIHEYTHLWDRALAKNNPELWKRGVKLMQEGASGLWNEIVNSENYGKLWQSQGIKGDKLINLIASEVHARLVGDNGAKLLDQIAKEQGNDSIIAKLKQWILDAWKELKATFSNWSQEEIDKLTLKDFNHMTVRDFADGINPNTVSSPSNATQNDISSSSTTSSFDAVLDENLSETSLSNNAAARKSETKPKTEKPKSDAYESALNIKDSRVAQFKRVFSPQQIKDRGAMIANIFSRIIDEHLWDLIDKQLDILEDENSTEQQKNDARETLHNLKDPITGRQFAAQDKQLPIILEEIKQELQWDLEAAKEDTKQLWKNTLDYFTDLFNTQATLDIEEKEGIRIIGLEYAEQTVSDDENDNQDDGDDEVGHIVSGSDGWNYQVRYTNPFDSLSRKIRGMLYEVERPESEKDDLGQQRYYPMGQIYASLLSYLAKNMQDSDTFLTVIKDFNELPETLRGSWKEIKDQETLDFRYPNGYPVFPVLEDMARVYPWVSQIINRLTNDYLEPETNSSLRYPSTGGAMASQFYTNFRKAYIPYGKIQIGINPETGKPYDSITPLNYQMEERVQRDKLEANYNNRMILTDHSIYNSDGTVNKENAKWLKAQLHALIQSIDEYIDYPEKIAVYENTPEEAEITADDVNRYNRTIDLIRKVLQSYGIDATQDSVVSYMMMEEGETLKRIFGDLTVVADKILKVADDKIADFNYMIDVKDNRGNKIWEHFFDNRGLITDASYMQSFYDSASKKTKYSYSADNYLMKVFRGVSMGTLDERRQYIDEHFGKYEWFRSQTAKKGTGWRNKWLEFFYNYEGDPNQIPYRNIDNITEYGKDEAIIRQYSKWTPDDVWLVQNRSYNPEAYHQKTAFYLAPIFSDSPMSMTVKGPKMSMEELLYGYTDDNNDYHQGALVSLVNQELWRIQYVQQRAQAIEEGRVKAIANFDTGVGQFFCFLPELNTYTFDNGELFLDRMMRLKREKATMKEIEASQIEAINATIGHKMKEYIAENRENYENKTLKEEQYYNMLYANAAIIQMVTVDLAFYGKGNRGNVNDTIHQMTVDFQKRFKEVYAGGIQLNTNSKYGKKTENIVLLSDDIITSPSYNKIASIIDSSERLTEADKKDIKATFTDINVADAQAIRSMHSFRSILDMMGNWTDEMEQALQHFKDGTWDRADFDIIYQTIKPFVYSVIERNDGNSGSILVPQQNKNSEICALMMYDLIANGLDASPVYKALSRFMEENLDADGNHLVDMAQFESAGKVGNQGVVNISFNPNKVIAAIEHGIKAEGNEFEFDTAYVDGKYLDNTIENVEANYRAIKEDLDKELAEGKTTQEEYNKIMSYFRPTEDEIVSMLEQAVLVTNPDGTKGINPEVVHTIPFDNYYQQQPTPEHHVDAEATFGSQARNISVADLPDDFEMSIKVKGGTHTFKGKDAIIDFYYELLNENLIEDFFGKGNNKGLKDIFSSKEALRDAVTEIVRGNPKYGRDFAEALQLDDNGNFVLSPNSPTIFNLMQEIVTSFFKNRITKQTINGAALIQAAGIGLDKDLRMVFDKDGKLVGAECLMPLTSKRFFEPLLETQIIDGKEVKILDPKKLKKAGLDKAIGYRIPTENKSSMMPLIIKDFTPLQNGSAIVLPAEITNIAGSDFDVDKMFIMLLSFGIDEEGNPYEIKYDFNKSPKENGRKARNNMLIQMIFGILTSKEGSESLLNPQGFKDFKRAAKINRILNDPTLKEQLVKNTSGEVDYRMLPSVDNIIKEFLAVVQDKYPYMYNDIVKDLRTMSTEQIQQAYIQAISAGNKGDAIELLLNSSTKDLEKFISRYSVPESPVYPQTFAHSHARNMAGTNQIGIYAIQASMDAKYQRADVRMRPEQQFTLNGRVIANVDVSDGGSRLKNVGQMVGASADNGKDPNLSDAGSTTKTAPIIGYMLRTGMSHLEAVLLINQRKMKDSNYRSSDDLWKWEEKNYRFYTPINVTTEMLIKGLISPFELTLEENRAIGLACYKILLQHEAQEYLTQISRADSPNGSIQNSYAKARIQRYKVDLFNAKMGQDDFPFVRIKDAISNDAIDTTASEEIIREQLKGQRMAFLHGMYALGINSFNGLVSPYFFGAKQWFDDRIVKPILYNLNEKLSDEKKEKIVNNIYMSYITYMLSASPLFGNEESSSMKQKRDYYLKTFPSDYQKIIQENEDIRELLGNILQVKTSDGRKRVVLQDVGSLSKGQKQDVQRRLEGLLYMKNPESAKIGEKLATDLLVYSYFDNGLQFTHDSFSHLFTTEFLTNFPAYTDTLNKLEDEITPEEEQNFIHQFLLTYHEAAYSVNGIINNDNHVFDDGNTIRVNIIPFDKEGKKMEKYMVNQVMSPNPRMDGRNVYPYIQYNGDIFVLDQTLFEQEPGMPTYHKLIPYQTYPKLPLFNIDMSVAKMAEEFPIDTEQSESFSADTVSPFMAHNEGDGDPNVGSNFAYDDIWDKGSWFDAINSPEVTKQAESGPSNTYQSEGEAELKDPFCGI